MPSFVILLGGRQPTVVVCLARRKIRSRKVKDFEASSRPGARQQPAGRLTPFKGDNAALVRLVVSKTGSDYSALLKEEKL